MSNLNYLLFLSFLLIFSCSSDDEIVSTSTDDYSGTASVSQGLASVVTSSLYACTDGRDSPVGLSTTEDGTVWTVPSEVNFTDSSFPEASDLYNDCNGNTFTSSESAIIALDGSEVIEIDSDGELITSYVFADNYFEMYINGVAVGKDKVPFTQFNSSIVRFRVSLPFTIAMKLVDWEENSGLGSEENQGLAYHPGDGGMVAVFMDENSDIIATTGAEWKAQTYYTAPIKDLTCATESGTSRLTTNCDTEGSNDATSFYALHWEIPSDWTSESFDDSEWPNASTYTNSVIGVDNKPAYTNFTNIFDDGSNDAEFIWSTNVILDNEVIVRYTVE